MRSRTIGRPDADGGAVAILTAMLALVLFGFAALAVELGDMYSRDAAVQTTADLAAFAGAQDLPNACAAFNSARDYLKTDKNGVFSDTDPTTFGASDTQLSDGDDANGEVEILDWDNNPLPVVSPCSDAGHRVKVTTPTRTINFPLAGGLPGAPDSGTVQGSAAVELRGLDLPVLPFSIPDSCPKGAQVIYTRDGIPSPPPGLPVFQPRGRRTGPWVDALLPDSAQTPVPPTMTIEVSLSRLRADPSLPGPAVQFDFHLFPAVGAPAVDGTFVPGSTTPNVANPAWFDARFTVPLPPIVQTTPGLWRVRGSQPAPGSNTYTPNLHVGTFTVTDPTPPVCTPTAGVYGLLASPRSDGGSPATKQAKNFILGIDHDLFPVVSPLTDQQCDTDGFPYADARLDDLSPTNGATCIDVRPVDFSAAPPTDGLVDGIGVRPGRLVGSATVTASPACNVTNDPDFQWTKNGQQLVDTALSCYLAPGKSLADVQTGAAGSLTAAILSDPRFFVIPTTDTSFHPSNESGPQYWPIKEFRGAFLTNETVAGGDASCDNDNGSECNGLVFNGSQVASVQAFTFPLSALQDTPDHPGNGRAYIGGPKDFLLVE